MDERRLLADSVGWDVGNWSRAVRFCTATSHLRPPGQALEVGSDGENGGLSLVLAARGWNVLCSGLEPPSPAKIALHRAHAVTGRVRYAVLDVLEDLPPSDLVVVKSVLGHVAQRGRDDRLRAALQNLQAAVRPGGELWLVENARASRVHAAARRRIGAGRTQWRYLGLDEIDDLLSAFPERACRTFGVVGALGRSEAQRRALSVLDRTVLERTMPARSHYVAAVVARKGGGADRAPGDVSRPPTSALPFTGGTGDGTGTPGPLLPVQETG